MNRPALCAHRGCGRIGRQGIGWGLSSGLNQFWCEEHYPPALARLAGLLRIMTLSMRRTG